MISRKHWSACNCQVCLINLIIYDHLYYCYTAGRAFIESEINHSPGTVKTSQALISFSWSIISFYDFFFETLNSELPQSTIFKILVTPELGIFSVLTVVLFY